MIPYQVDLIYLLTSDQQQALMEAWEGNRHRLRDLAGIRAQAGITTVYLDDYEPGQVTKAMQIVAEILDGIDTQPVKPFIPGGKD